MTDKTKNLKWWLKLIIQILTVIASFLGGQASAKNDVINIFNKHQIENVK